MHEEGAEDAAVPLFVPPMRPQRGNARARLLTAAADLYCRLGYLAVSVDDIASTAGVSRVTFYRQFADKATLTSELFAIVSEGAFPIYAGIAQKNYRDPTIVADWIRDVFAADQKQPLIRAFTEALIASPEFLPRAQRFTDRVMSALADGIPAFDVDPNDPARRRQWLEGWLLLYHISDHSNHAALRSGIASDPLIVDILTEQFATFVARYPSDPTTAKSSVAGDRCD